MYWHPSEYMFGEDVYATLPRLQIAQFTAHTSPFGIRIFPVSTVISAILANKAGRP